MPGVWAAGGQGTGGTGGRVGTVMDDNGIRRIQELQQELDRRQKVEREAEALMCQGKVQESLQLISTLDDSVADALLT